MVMFFRRAGRMRKTAGLFDLCLKLDCESPRHAQMRQQGFAAFQTEEKVFGTPVQPLDPYTGQALGKPVRKRKTQIRPAILGALDEASLHDRSQPLADSFNFRKLGHDVALVQTSSLPYLPSP